MKNKKAIFATFLTFLTFFGCNQEIVKSSNQEAETIQELESEVNKIVASKKWLWKSKEINVFLRTGTTKHKQYVKFFANIWSEYANIKFNFFNVKLANQKFDIIVDTSEIPSNFATNGLSFIGTGSKSSAKKGLASMTLQINASASPADIKGLVLHEFGHALGLHHEHQHPDRIFVYNEQAVLNDCLSRGTSLESCKQNNLDLLDSDDYQKFTYDSNSIMHYKLHPNHISKFSGDQEIFSDTRSLSLLDKIAIAKLYPGKITEDEIRVKHQEHMDNVYASDTYGNCSIMPFVGDLGTVTYAHVNDLDPADRYRSHFVFSKREDVLLNMQFDPNCGSPLSTEPI